MIKRIFQILCVLAFAFMNSQALEAHKIKTGDGQPLRILAVGNSWSLNATNYVGNMMEELGYDTKIISNKSKNK